MAGVTVLPARRPHSHKSNETVRLPASFEQGRARLIRPACAAAPAPRQGAAAMLLTNKPSLQRRAKYSLERRCRMHIAAREDAYR